MTNPSVDVIVEPGNPYDFDDEELDELSTFLTKAQPDLEVGVFKRTETGYGVTGGEVLVLWMALTGSVEAAKTTASAVKWAKARWERDRRSHSERPRKRFVITMGPDDEIISEFEIDLPSGEPREITGSREPGLKRQRPKVD